LVTATSSKKLNRNVKRCLIPFLLSYLLLVSADVYSAVLYYILLFIIMKIFNHQTKYSR